MASPPAIPFCEKDHLPADAEHLVFENEKLADRGKKFASKKYIVNILCIQKPNHDTGGVIRSQYQQAYANRLRRFYGAVINHVAVDTTCIIILGEFMP